MHWVQVTQSLLEPFHYVSSPSPLYSISSLPSTVSLCWPFLYLFLALFVRPHHLLLLRLLYHPLAFSLSPLYVIHSPCILFGLKNSWCHPFSSQYFLQKSVFQTLMVSPVLFYRIKLTDCTIACFFLLPHLAYWALMHWQ